MKKTLAFLLAALMLICMAGCAAKAPADQETGGESEEKIELTFWAHQQLAWNDSYEAIAAAFTAENPNITIKYEFFPYDDFESKLQTSLIAKSGGADIFELWGGWATDFAPTGALAALPDELAAEIMEESYPATYGALLHDGKLYGMPFEFNIECGGMLVNLGILEQNGMEIPTTWDALIEDAKKATVEEEGQLKVKGFDFVNWDSPTFLLTSMILSNGGNYRNEDGTFNFTSPEAKDAFNTLATLVKEDKVTDLLGLTGGGDLESYQALFADQALFVPRGPWTIAEGVDTFELTYGEDFTYAPLPWYGDNAAFPAETGWSIAINGGSEKQEAAFKFLEFFYRDDVLLGHDISCALIPPKVDVAHDPALIEEMPFLEVLVGILDKGEYIGNFNTDVFKETINNVFVDYCLDMYGSLDEALADLEGKLNSSLAE